MRVALITPGFSAGEDDWCIPAIYDLVRALSRTDDVTVFALRYPHHREPYSFFGARVVPLGGAQRRGIGRLAMGLQALAAIRREARRAPFDVIHALWAHEPGYLAAVAGRRLGTPVLVSLLGGELADLPEIGYGGGRGRLNPWLVRRALAGAARITVGSRFLDRLALGPSPPLPEGEGSRSAESLRDGRGPFREAKHDRVTMAPLGVDLERFAPAPGPDDPVLAGSPALLSAGSLVPVKDPDTLLDAFARLATDRPGAHLHLVGDGPLAPALRRRTDQLEVASRITFHGAVDHGALAGYYRAADLAVLASRFESQGMVLLEALACGCPVAGTAVGLLPELAPDHVVPPGDPGALAHVLARALDEPRAPESCRDLARPFVLAETVERWRALYGRCRLDE